ncbi:MAG: thioesterase family protein [Abditibacteriaceae bacterium]
MLVSLRVSDVDINQHLNQSVYYEFFDTAVLRYLEQFKAIDKDINKRATVCVENGCRYRREVEFNDSTEVALRVAHIGTSSVRFELAVFTEGFDDPNTVAYFVLVFVDKETHRPVSIPAELKQAM